MNDNTHKVELKSSIADLYAALLLSDKLENEQNNTNNKENENPPPISSSNSPSLDTPLKESESIYENQKDSLDYANVDVIWVPADKHPQIAPIEFAKFIKTHGANTPTRRSTTLHRRKSILSQSMTVLEQRNTLIDHDEEEEEELHRTLSEKKRLFLKKVMTNNEQLKDINSSTQIFDRNSTSIDDSRIIAPRADKSLLRRSAFSARGRNRKTFNFEDRQQMMQRRSVSQRKPNEDSNFQSKVTAAKPAWNISEGVSLYDQPVNMSEWIDLGSVSLESDDSQRGILSRVHDAESQLLLQIDDKEKATKSVENSQEENEDKEDKAIHHIEKEEASNIIETKTDSIAIHESPKRPKLIRLETETTSSSIPSMSTKPEKRVSWLGGLLFNDKKNGKASNKKERLSMTDTIISSHNNSPLSGLASIFSRSLSVRSNITYTNDNSILSKLKNKSNHLSPTITTTTSSTINTTSNTTNNNITFNNTTYDAQKKQSSRLDTVSSPELKLFNYNRLPLHVERAIYRLSHLKLTNPRRSLYQQVLISNLMFWYLSIQQTDFQQLAEKRLEMTPISDPNTLQQQKKIGKVTRFINSAKKRGNEVAQFVQTHPLANHQQETTSHRSSLKQSSVQFNLKPIPSHHPSNHNEEEEEEEDNIPLSRYKK
ncbi:uncharacterized protein BX663DRAFT_548469 [Cokeromyces recurvatus]|uniref:uncharacterized protein n=1 Tax=Cokeromyces recurvatus TaxID=90255 RepID=UPI00221ED3D0|nr:uncharacterized protein BX663DRAFT_548469 [Cokeromyces recurvatus]KAI7907426.1 hypothetical protein BX663DRAFT_548469 [Cokeromyces recurvatus]